MLIALRTEEPATPPPASPEPPATPVKVRTTKSSPTTPQRTAANGGYDVESPTKVGCVVTWFEAGSLTQGVPRASVRASSGGCRRSRKAAANVYAVFYGGEVGSFEEWTDVQRSINGHGVAIHAGFPTLQAAEAALADARTKGWTADSSPPASSSDSPLAPPGRYEDNPLSHGSTGSWYAVCRGVVPGVYRSYLECTLNTVGVRGNLCASFATRAEAESAFAQAQKANFVRTLSRRDAIV